MTPDELEVRTFQDAAAWESWLAEHHEDRPGVWAKIARKGSGVQSMSAAEGTEVALCFGWIDSHRKAGDAAYFLQKYTPRRPRSSWSRVNRARVEELIAAGRVREPGLAEVKAAKADGRWDAAYEPQRNATVPSDLEAALGASATARSAFESLGKTDRYALILRLLKARSEDQRAARLRKIVSTLEASPRR